MNPTTNEVNLFHSSKAIEFLTHFNQDYCKFSNLIVEEVVALIPKY